MLGFVVSSGQMALLSRRAVLGPFLLRAPRETGEKNPSVSQCQDIGGEGTGNANDLGRGFIPAILASQRTASMPWCGPAEGLLPERLSEGSLRKPPHLPASSLRQLLVAKGVTHSPESCPGSRWAGCWLWTPLLRDRHADIPGRAWAAIRQEGGPRVLVQGCCNGGKDRVGAEEVGGVAQVAHREALLRLGPQRRKDLGGQQLVVQEDALAPLPGERAVEGELRAAAGRALPVAALGMPVPHGHALGTETRLLCAVFIPWSRGGGNPSRNGKLVLLLYWLKPWVWRAGSGSPL